ncbi:hypothetical protein U14_01793 [Candidatus Moduliflexus flocculans]|uniref:Uncharacterized protein n=1 Tax=Candidatus Moduliflexus flocculans TaxID=1499966 RepID=A0A0S6VYB7_9BACT|nr:hypothetical protein U14_01793 [Candidatus Moduliflexus flocculans]
MQIVSVKLCQQDNKTLDKFQAMRLEYDTKNDLSSPFTELPGKETAMRSRMILMVYGAFLWMFVVHLSIPPVAEAYLDPGTGSYFLQVLAAGLLSGLFMLKPIVSKIKNLFAKLQGRSKEDDSGENF